MIMVFSKYGIVDKRSLKKPNHLVRDVEQQENIMPEVKYNNRIGDMEELKLYHKNGQLKCHIFKLNHRYSDFSYHRYDENGKLISVEYLKDGKYHREDGPAIQSWLEDGELYENIYSINGEFLPIKTDEELKNYIKTLCLR